MLRFYLVYSAATSLNRDWITGCRYFFVSFFSLSRRMPKTSLQYATNPHFQFLPNQNSWLLIFHLWYTLARLSLMSCNVGSKIRIIQPLQSKLIQIIFKILNSTSMQPLTICYSEVWLNTLTGLFLLNKSRKLLKTLRLTPCLILTLQRKHHKQHRNSMCGRNTEVSNDKRDVT